MTKKPAIYKIYDFTKGGTDIVDQRMGTYSVSTKSWRWVSTAFSYVLDTSRINAGTIYSLNTGKNPRAINSFNFGLELAMAMVKPFIESRSLVGLNSKVTQKIELVLEKKIIKKNAEPQVNYPGTSSDKKRCKICLVEVTGINQKENKDNIPKTKKRCQKCNIPMCPKHTVFWDVKCAALD